MKRSRRRPMKAESLEIRQCFAVDIGALLASLDVPQDVIEIVRYNYQQPTDVNVDGYTTPLDALSVINELNLGSEVLGSDMMADTNGDRLVSALDALVVINHLNQSSTVAFEDINQDPAASTLPAVLAQVDEVIRQLTDNSQSTPVVSDALDSQPMDSGTRDQDTQDQDTQDQGRSLVGRTYDPTDDNGNGFFLSPEDARPVSLTIEAELRRQLRLDESALIKVAVYQDGGENQSGTWQYLTEEGISIWGNWRLPTQSPEDLRLFLSNVEEENRIYGQYPDGSFLYFSWVDEGPVGFYFTPLTSFGVADPVPLQRYIDYFAMYLARKRMERMFTAWMPSLAI